MAERIPKKGKTTKKAGKTNPNAPPAPHEGYVSRMGRPPKFETVDQMETVIDAYFAYCEVNKLPLTITGLGLALGMSRQALLDYQNKDEFLDTVKRAKAIVENFAEIKLLTEGGSGAIFALKNFGWKDKTEVYQEHTYTQMPTIKAKLSDGTTKELSFNVGKKREKKK